MEAQRDSLTRFVSRLFDTPALRPLPILQKEEQPLQFRRASGPQLQPVFSSLGLDIRRSWREAAGEVARGMRAEANRLLAQELSSISATRLTLSFSPAMAGGPQPARAREKLRTLLQTLAQRHARRSALSGSHRAVRSELTDKYIPRIAPRKKCVCIEVSRVTRKKKTLDPPLCNGNTCRRSSPAFRRCCPRSPRTSRQDTGHCNGGGPGRGCSTRCT